MCMHVNLTDVSTYKSIYIYKVAYQVDLYGHTKYTCQKKKNASQDLQMGNTNKTELVNNINNNNNKRIGKKATL